MAAVFMLLAVARSDAMVTASLASGVAEPAAFSIVKAGRCCQHQENGLKGPHLNGRTAAATRTAQLRLDHLLENAD